MTRCPKTCDKSDPEGKAHGPCELKPGHVGLCVAFGQTWDSSTAPAPPDAPSLLDFEKAHAAGLAAIGDKDGPSKAERAALNAQAAALVETAVAENDRMWGLSIIPLGADHIHAVTTRFIALREARDDHR